MRSNLSCGDSIKEEEDVDGEDNVGALAAMDAETADVVIDLDKAKFSGIGVSVNISSDEDNNKES
jgi:hypothetical protein